MLPVAAPATQIDRFNTLRERMAAGQTTRFGTPLCDGRAYAAAERQHGYNLGVTAFYAGKPDSASQDEAMTGVPAGYPYCNNNASTSCMDAWRRGYRDARLGLATPLTQPEPAYHSAMMLKFLAAA